MRFHKRSLRILALAILAILTYVTIKTMTQSANISSTTNFSAIESMDQEDLEARIIEFKSTEDTWTLLKMVAVGLAAVFGLAAGFLEILENRAGGDKEVAQERLAGLIRQKNDLEIAQANARALSAQVDLEAERNIRIKREDRKFTPAQREELVAKLSAFGKAPRFVGDLRSDVPVIQGTFPPVDDEARKFAEELSGALNSAKWRASTMSRMFVPPDGEAPNLLMNPPERLGRGELVGVGVQVSTTPDGQSRFAAETLVSELNRLGFDATFKTESHPRVSDLGSKNPLIWIVVGYRPEGAQGATKVELARAKAGTETKTAPSRK